PLLPTPAPLAARRPAGRSLPRVTWPRPRNMDRQALRSSSPARGPVVDTRREVDAPPANNGGTDGARWDYDELARAPIRSPGPGSAGVLDRLSISEHVVFDAVCRQANTLCALAESLPNRLPSMLSVSRGRRDGPERQDRSELRPQADQW